MCGFEKKRVAPPSFQVFGDAVTSGKKDGGEGPRRMTNGVGKRGLETERCCRLGIRPMLLGISNVNL